MNGNNELFVSMRMASKLYAYILDNELGVEAQLKALDLCQTILKTILDKNLCDEYNDWYATEVAKEAHNK